MMEKIEEDKQFQVEMQALRQQEIEMLSRESDSFFSQEAQHRKEQELMLSRLIDEK
jgi:hypothetical protein